MNQEKKPTNAEPDEQPPVPERRAEPKETSSARRPLIYLITIVVIFLLGFIPMWFKAANREKERDTARRELRLVQIHLALASAAIDARRGEYEPARLFTISFFTSLTAEIHQADESAIQLAQREALEPLLQQRDDLVTLLARSDPASAERLSSLYVNFRNAVAK